jgi:hypothetical protein
MRPLRSLAVLAVLSALLTPGVALADEDAYAELTPTDADPNASGYAYFGPVSAEEPDNIALEVHVRGVSSTDAVDIWIDGEPLFTGIRLTDGAFDFFRDGLDFYDANDIEIVDSYDGTRLLSGDFEY